MKKSNLAGLILSVAGILISVISLPFLPSLIPVNFGYNGETTAFGSKLTVLFIGALPALVYYGLGFLRLIDPKRENYNKFKTVFTLMRVFVAMFMLVLEIMTIVNALCPNIIDVSVIITMFSGLLICVFGNYMPKLRHNFFCGIRTPWTLASEECWIKTHRLAGKAWFFGGAAMAVMPFFLKGSLLFFALMSVTAVVLMIIPCIYSYFVFPKKKG